MEEFEYWENMTDNEKFCYHGCIDSGHWTGYRMLKWYKNKMRNKYGKEEFRN